MNSFTYSFEIKKDYAVIYLNGSLLTSVDAKPLLENVDKEMEGIHAFLIDLGNLKHLSSEGLNALLHILTKSRNMGGETILFNLSTHVKSLFIITKLSNIFTITNDLKSATALIKGRAKK